MTFKEWIELIGLIIVILGALGAMGAGIWWAGGQHRDLRAAIQTDAELKVAIENLTKATTELTTETKEHRAKMESWQEDVNKQLRDTWTEIGKLRDRRNGS